jgi:hypothetical protein
MIRNFKNSALIVISLLTILYSCTKETSFSKNETETAAVSARPSPKSTSSFGDYAIALSVSSDGKVWTYTITRAKANAKNLSHLIIDLNNCGEKSATFANIVSATVNGQPANLSPSEGSGTGCNPQSTTTNFVKINFTAASSWVLVLTFERGYETFATANAWVKAGSSCNIGIVPAPGCPKEEYCSFSQGFFFASGSFSNGSATLWANGLTIGGVAYTQANGTNFWTIDRGRGGDQTMNAFFQLGAVRLSGAESEVAADAAIVDGYFSGLNVSTFIKTGTSGPNTFQYFDLPATNNNVTKAQAIAAGSKIGAYIDVNHCD